MLPPTGRGLRPLGKGKEMMFEYWVVPAPRKGEKARGLKTSEERFAFALTTLMNTMAEDGWEYLRADALPCDERSGLTGTKTTFHSVLVFRRPLADEDDMESQSEAGPSSVPNAAGAQRAAALVAARPVAEAASLTAVPPPLPAAQAAPLGGAVQPLGASPTLVPAKTAD